MCSETKQGRISCDIIENTQIAEGIYRLVLAADSQVKEAKPGQFVNVYCHGKDKLLPRPISICEVDIEKGLLILVYAASGSGTVEISYYEPGQTVELLGPLGNGYSLRQAKTSILVGGGVGTPPLVELAKRLEGDKLIYIGFRSEPYLIQELERYGKVFVATEDGSFGHQGNVIELMNQTSAFGDHLYACGPKPMLKAIQVWAKEKQISAQLSLEERMGCGFGACVGCVVRIKEDSERGYHYKKVCKDGPVFESLEVLL